LLREYILSKNEGSRSGKSPDNTTIAIKYQGFEPRLRTVCDRDLKIMSGDLSTTLFIRFDSDFVQTAESSNSSVSLMPPSEAEKASTFLQQPLTSLSSLSASRPSGHFGTVLGT